MGDKFINEISNKLTKEPLSVCEGIIVYTVILKDSYTLTPNLNMKKWL